MAFWSKVLDILYPDNHLCLICGRNFLFSEINHICDSCLSRQEFMNNYCHVCGREIDNSDKFCSFCQADSFEFDMARSAGIYDGLLKKLLLKFKYEHLLKIQEPLVELLSIAFENYYISENIDYIIPVPIHNNRRLERGYNQAALLAKGLSLYTGIQVSTAIRRIKDNPPLFNFDFKKRRVLLNNSFYVEKNYFTDMTVLLVDDIFTTGATANEISRLLKEVAAAERVLVLTVATARTY